MKRKAIVIIIANSCAGTPSTFSGESNFSVASVSFSGDVVNVSNDDNAIINTNRKQINKPARRPSSVAFQNNN